MPRLKHGRCVAGKNDRTWFSWRDMRKRCNDPSCKAYPYYGGRGIKVCRRWNEFKAFLEDMGDCPPGLTLERKNVNKGYYKANCRWATRKDQIANRRPVKEWRAPPGPVPGKTKHSVEARKRKSEMMLRVWAERRALQ